MTSPAQHFDSGILAIDPATQVGFAYLHDGFLVQSSFSLAVTPADKWGLRAWRMFGFIMDLAEERPFARIVYEESSKSTLNHNTTVFHGMIAGAIEVAAGQLGIPTSTHHPSSLKAFATGYGAAKKEQMIRAVHLLFGVRAVDDNAADAIMLLAVATAVARGKYQPPTAKRGSQRSRANKPAAPRLFK